MTENKPIIIDGIDVSECEQLTYKDSLNPMCGNTGTCCYGRDNCYFKQLTRKTQECDEALTQLEFVRTLNTVKEAENRKLSKTLTEIKEIAAKRNYLDYNECLDDILQKISEREVKMKTEKEIKERLDWLIKALDDPDNQTEKQQIKLYAQIDFIKWLGVK